MPSTTFQARINAFESTSNRPPPSPSPSPPNLGRKTSLIDLKDWVVDDGPTPTQLAFSRPLISFESPPKPKPKPKPKPVSLKSPPKLPPRKPSFTSRKDSLAPDSPRGHAPSSSISSFHSVSLSSDTDPSTPGSASNFIATFPIDQRSWDADSISLSESYEEVSADIKPIPPKLPQRPPSASKSPIPSSTPVASPSSSSPSSPYVPRRAAPPPPPSSRASDRSSIQSTISYASSFSSLNLKAKRPTPVPLAARKRYEVVFTANVVQRRRAEIRRQDQDDKPSLLSPVEARGRRAAGWRGLSVDLITAGDFSPTSPTQSEQVDETVDSGEVLQAAIVKCIWKRSGLDTAQLAEIWNECDLTGVGALSVDAFVKGMWRIDEELRRAQTQAIKSATSHRPNSTLPVRSVPQIKIPHRPRDILR